MSRPSILLLLVLLTLGFCQIFAVESPANLDFSNLLVKRQEVEPSAEPELAEEEFIQTPADPEKESAGDEFLDPEALNPPAAAQFEEESVAIPAEGEQEEQKETASSSFEEFNEDEFIQTPSDPEKEFAGDEFLDPDALAAAPVEGDAPVEQEEQFEAAPAVVEEVDAEFDESPADPEKERAGDEFLEPDVLNPPAAAQFEEDLGFEVEPQEYAAPQENNEEPAFVAEGAEFVENVLVSEPEVTYEAGALEANFDADSENAAQSAQASVEEQEEEHQAEASFEQVEEAPVEEFNFEAAEQPQEEEVAVEEENN